MKTELNCDGFRLAPVQSQTSTLHKSLRIDLEYRSIHTNAIFLIFNLCKIRWREGKLSRISSELPNLDTVFCLIFALKPNKHLFSVETLKQIAED